MATRFDWFRHFAICNTTLDVSLWRFRYLRALAAKLTTDPKQMKELAAAYDLIEAEAPKLFQYDRRRSSAAIACRWARSDARRTWAIRAR